MTFDEARAKVASYLHSGDTNEPMLSTADRDRVIHEAYWQVYAAYTALFGFTSDYPRTGSMFTVGLSAERQWIECETCEVLSGSNYIPLKRGSFGQMLFMNASEGATGTPEEYGLALVSRNITSGLSLIRVAVYPRPLVSTSYRFRIKVFPPELSAGGDLLEMEKTPAEYVCRIAAARLGAIIGYSEAWESEVMYPVPEQLRSEIDFDKLLRWPQTVATRVIGGADDGV